MMGLFGKQLASITNTLAKASQRRDAELQRRMSPKPPVAPATHIPSAASPTDLSLTSDTEESTSSVSGGDSVVFGGRRTKPNMQTFERYDLDLPQANTIIGWIYVMPKVHEPLTNELTDEKTPRGFMRGGYATDDEDLTNMLAHLATIDSAAPNDNVDAKEMFARFGASEPTVSAGTAEEDLKTELSQMSQATPHLNSRSEDVDNINPAQVLAEFGSVSCWGQSTVRGESSEDINPEQLLTALECSLPLGAEAEAEAEAPVSVSAGFDSSLSAHTLATDPEWEARFDELLQGPRTLPSHAPQTVLGNENDEDPRGMLAELERESTLDNDTDPRRMIAELERGMLEENVDEDNDDNLEALRIRLTGTLSPVPSHVSPAPESTNTRTTSRDDCSGAEDVVALDKNLVPFVIALQLEAKGLPWKKLQGWTTYLFGSGLDGYKACQEKDAVVKQATEELAQTMQQVMGEERHYKIIENETRLPCRLIVSNIAAGADVEDLKEVFSPFRFVM
jgi:hypothetical protein